MGLWFSWRWRLVLKAAVLAPLSDEARHMKQALQQGPCLLCGQASVHFSPGLWGFVLMFSAAFQALAAVRQLLGLLCDRPLLRAV